MNDTSETPGGDGKDERDDTETVSAVAAEDNGHADALPLIARFGGIRPMASKLGVPVSTVQGWKERDAIPVNRLEAIKAAARQHDIELLPEDVVLQVESDGGDAKPDEGPAAALKPSAEEKSAEMKPAQQSRLVLVVALAALVISVLSVLAALFAMRPQDSDVAGLEQRLAALEAAPAASGGDISGVEGRIAVLETIVDGLDADSLAARLTAVEDAAAGGGAAATSEGDPAGGADLLALADRVDAAERSVLAGDEALQERLAAMEVLVETLGGAVPREDGSPTVAVDLAPLTSRLVALENTVAGLAPQEIPAVDLTGIEGRLERLEGELENIGTTEIVETDRAIGLTLAAIQLRAALGTGEDFEGPFLRARALAASDEELLAVLEPLAPLASTGVMTLDALRNDFDKVARALTLDEAEAEGGWTDRMVGRLNSVVSVRRTDAEPGDDGIGARVARARVRLDAGDPGGALAALGPPGIAESERVTQWREAVAGRLAVDKAIAALEGFAYTNLAQKSTQ